MFTGIVTDLGRVRAVLPGGDTGYEITTHYDIGTIALGASIACSGVCLTVVATGSDWFRVQVSAETRARSTVGAWRVGSAINLERPLKLGDEFGGHMVAGHVDGVGRLASAEAEGDSTRMVFDAPSALSGGIASKGSIAVDGVSLTVNEVTDARFGVNIIAHTKAVTTLGGLKIGDPVNLELDMIARYVARLMGKELA
jgi:riboflavin synthase